MSGKNAYLEKQRKMQQSFLDVGEEMGIQKICDYLHIALRDPEVMGKDVFGRKRLEKLSGSSMSWRTTTTPHSRMTRKLTWSRKSWTGI